MERFAGAVTAHYRAIIIIFAIITALCALLISTVRVDYNLADYLPPDAQSTKALAIMEDEFPGALPNASVLVRNVSVAQALDYKQRLAQTEGVEEVLWLDDTVDVKQPLEMADREAVEAFYKDGCALYTVTVSDDKEREAVESIRKIIGDRGVVAGTAADNVSMMQATTAEVGNAAAILVPVIVVILVLSSASWMDPVLYLLAIGSAIVINMGTNAAFGEVSFVTSSVSPILQLAVSLDYSIFLLHSFERHRQHTADVRDAMKRAIRESASTVASSMMTTLFGFLSLAFMNFRIGADLGINLAKGILFSFLCTLIFLPAVTLALYRVTDRTKHRPLLPSFSGVYRFFSKTAVPAVVITAIVIVPCFLAQARTQFVYGNDAVQMASYTETAGAQKEIEEEFGSSSVMALLVPAGDVAREKTLGEKILELPHVTSLVSYAHTVGTAYPASFLGTDITSQFFSPDWARLVIYTDTASEGEEAFGTVERILDTAEQYYGDEVYAAGTSANLYDMRKAVEVDNVVVTLIAAAAIFLVLLFTFRSAVLPFILLLTIETAIWINLSIPYFTDTPINFIGYLVLNTVQLGATVDYAILLTTTYLRRRRLLPQKEAMHSAMGESFGSILVSASVLAVAGFTLYLTSSNPPVRDIGLLLGRGTILSFILVMCFLPAMLRFLDGLIARTTWHADFQGRTRKQPSRLRMKEESFEG